MKPWAALMLAGIGFVAMPLPAAQVRVGACAALSGPAAARGQAFVRGLQSGLAQANAAASAHLIELVVHDDAFGRAGREGLRDELARMASKPVAQAIVDMAAKDGEIGQAVESVCRERPQALVLMLDRKRIVPAFKRVKHAGCTQAVYVPNESGSPWLADPNAAPWFAGAVVAQVVPHPEQLSLPLVADYRRQVPRVDTRLWYPSFEGYLYARVIVEAVQRCSRDLTRRCMASALEGRPLDVGGVRLRFSPTDHRGTRWVDMSLITSDGRLRR